MANWMTTRYDINDAYIYIGTHTQPNASTADSQWYIRKFIFDSSGNPTAKYKRIGSWDNRDNLDWG